jgi:hypothetical protein
MKGAWNQEPTPSVQPDPLWHPVLTKSGNAQFVSRVAKKILFAYSQRFKKENQAH